MVRAEFFKDDKGLLAGFSVRGHADYGVAGDDVACASVSSAVQFACNLITECFKAEASVTAVGETVNLLITEGGPRRSEAMAVVEALKLHLELIGEEYPEAIATLFTQI